MHTPSKASKSYKIKIYPTISGLLKKFSSERKSKRLTKILETCNLQNLKT